MGYGKGSSNASATASSATNKERSSGEPSSPVAPQGKGRFKSEPDDNEGSAQLKSDDDTQEDSANDKDGDEQHTDPCIKSESKLKVEFDAGEQDEYKSDAEDTD